MLQHIDLEHCGAPFHTSALLQEPTTYFFTDIVDSNAANSIKLLDDIITEKPSVNRNKQVLVIDTIIQQTLSAAQGSACAPRSKVTILEWPFKQARFKGVSPSCWRNKALNN